METATISAIDTFVTEMDEQAAITRNFMALVPEDKFDWAPHEKSMKMIVLATHIAELPSWATLAVNTEELDFLATPYQPVAIAGKEELMDYFEKSNREGRSSLETANDAKLRERWQLKSGAEIHVDCTKAEMIRTAINQIVHHRAQLGVYFRLLGIPVPESFGPTADSVKF